MLLIRLFEETTAEQYAKGKITGFTHLYSGEEAVAVGAMSVISDKDYVVSSYREHGHALIKGVTAREVMAELFGKSTGVSHGRGGSMHLFDPDIRFMGGYAIVAGGIPISAGIAQAVKYRGGEEIVASFFGDGAVNQGVFHETVNLAKLWSLPLVFICENNFYGIGTNVSRASAVEDLYKRVCGFNIHSVQVDGMDVLAVRKGVDEAVRITRGGGGPTFVEAKTYRFRGHSMSDPDEYRSKMELKIWRDRDPIKKFAEHLLKEDVATRKKLDALQKEVEEEIADAVEFADKSAEPPLTQLQDGLYSKGGNS